MLSLLGSSGVSAECSQTVRGKDCAREISDGKQEMLGTGLEVRCVTFWQRICPHFVHGLRPCGATFKGGGPLNLVEDISAQPSF